jgi:hypothetical protein
MKVSIFSALERVAVDMDSSWVERVIGQLPPDGTLLPDGETARWQGPSA